MLIKNQFYGVIPTASNIGSQEGNYNGEMFLEDFPQFFHDGGESWLPCSVISQFINMANKAIQPDKWLDSWRYAAGLYVAHNAAMYLKSFGSEPGGESKTAAAAAASGDVLGTVKSATLGDASVTYDDSAATQGISDWAGLTQTKYGQQLATMARMVGMGGSYVL